MLYGWRGERLGEKWLDQKPNVCIFIFCFIFFCRLHINCLRNSIRVARVALLRWLSVKYYLFIYLSLVFLGSWVFLVFTSSLSVYSLSLWRLLSPCSHFFVGVSVTADPLSVSLCVCVLLWYTSYFFVLNSRSREEECSTIFCFFFYIYLHKFKKNIYRHESGTVTARSRKITPRSGVVF